MDEYTMKTKTKQPKMDIKRPLSWSAISSFEFSPEQWYKKYVLKQEDKPSKEMIFGKAEGERLAFDRKYLPNVPRETISEHKLFTSFDGIPLIGFIDFLSTDHRKLFEMKTGKNPWNQQRVDSHGQLDMYLLCLYLMEKIKPEDIDITLVWLPTQETLVNMKDNDSTISYVQPFECKVFKTKRRMSDILVFGARLKKTWRAMQAYRPS